MNKELTVVENKGLTNYSQEQEDIIARTIAPGLTKDELNVFLHNCMRTGLDPFAKQIYAIKRGGRMCIQTGIDGFRLIAERTGKYSPGKDTEFLYDENKRLLGAKVFVKKLTDDGTWHDISSTALVVEYNPGQGLWKKMPHVMIEKCAEARVLRRAFPADLSGLYTQEEMEQAEEDNGAGEAVKTPSDPIISDETWSNLDEFLNGHDELRKKLKDLCCVTELSNIRESQLEAVRNKAISYMKDLNESKLKLEK